MSKRSKVSLIVLIVLVLTIFLSLLNEKPATDEKLESWEEEISNPNNKLDPLDDKVGDNVFIIDIAQKIENVINKVFSFIIGFFEEIIEIVLILNIN